MAFKRSGVRFPSSPNIPVIPCYSLYFTLNIVKENKIIQEIFSHILFNSQLFPVIPCCENMMCESKRKCVDQKSKRVNQSRGHKGFTADISDLRHNCLVKPTGCYNFDDACSVILYFLSVKSLSNSSLLEYICS